jgi:manganese oxidase
MRVPLLSLAFCLSISWHASAQIPRLTANDNRAPAGLLAGSVLTLNLELGIGRWHPDAEDMPGIDVIAIREAGRMGSIPGPLIRVPLGTEVRASVHNTLGESVLFFGLNGSHALADSVRLQPGETRSFVIKADAAGNFMYGAMRRFRAASPENPAVGNDQTASGAFVVDVPGKVKPDRVLVINTMLDTVRAPGMTPALVRLATLNGKSWPHTERFVHEVGDSISWRVINTSLIPHPMHLHGFYFDVTARGDTRTDSVFEASKIRKAVTERMTPLSTMSMVWTPERSGHWLFHCHLPLHTELHAPLGPVKASGHGHVHDVPHGMSNLMMGITVNGPAPSDGRSRRQVRLNVHQHDSVAGDKAPRWSYSFSDAPERNAAGPTIVLQQNEPVAITVINRGKAPTAVHWHGIELESFNDGTPGFGGYGSRVSPLIAPNDSFIARMTPPRAGTFIYHTHVDEVRQQPGGLYGALVVLEPGKTLDPEAERVILLGTPNDSAHVLINGEAHPVLNMKAGKTYRLRMVQIMIGRPAIYATIVDGESREQPLKLVAKDGADLPEHQQARITRQPMAPGETYDALFTPTEPGDVRFEVRMPNGTVLGHAILRVQSQSQSANASAGRVAFSRTREDISVPGDYRLDTEIWTMNHDGTNARRLTRNTSDDFGAAWSPDEKTILFGAVQFGPDGKGDLTPVNAHIYSIDANGGEQVLLTPSNLRAQFPSWSNDGSKIVFHGSYGAANRDREIFQIDPDGKNLRQLTTNQWPDMRPDWSPDGSRIAFQSSRDGSNEIFVMNADGSNVIQLTNNDTSVSNQAPDWSPDGDRIVFVSEREGNADIYVMDSDGKSVKRLTTDPRRDTDPEWSSDGRIAFDRFMVTGDAEHRQIFIIDADGSNLTPLTSLPSSSGHAAWSRPSKR